MALTRNAAEIGKAVAEAMHSPDFIRELSAALTETLSASLIQPVKELIAVNTSAIANLREEGELRAEEVKGLKTMVIERTDEHEQYVRRNSLRIFGIPETPRESTEDKVLALAAEMGVTLKMEEIDRCHRVGQKRDANQNRPILCKFVSYASRHKVFTAKKKLKGKNIGIGEDLTLLRREMLKAAIAHFGGKNVWTIDGVILIKNEDCVHRVKTINGLIALDVEIPQRITDLIEC